MDHSKPLATELLDRFEQKAPEIVFEWTDAETGAKGWTVINSLRGGAAGGGTRMRQGLTKDEVTSLAKTMEVKFSVSGPGIGGAKSGIDFDPNDPRKEEVLKRWYAAVFPLLKNYYGTGGDLNIDEVAEVIPITEALGLLHPQEGVLMGHFKPSREDKVEKIAQLRLGVSLEIDDEKYSPDPARKFKVADMITGWGVSESVRHYYGCQNKNLKGKRAIIQGWGNVAAAAAYYLAEEGVKIVGIIDRQGGLINEEGYSFADVRQMFLNKLGNRLYHPQMLSFEEVEERIWDIPADIFIPAAASRLVERHHLDRMQKAGVQVISAGANVPFKEDRIFYGAVTAYADQNFTVIPDFIANCGMARGFAYLMQSHIDLSAEGIFNDVSECINTAVKDVYNRNSSGKEYTKAAFEIALNKIM